MLRTERLPELPAVRCTPICSLGVRATALFYMQPVFHTALFSILASNQRSLFVLIDSDLRKSVKARLEILIRRNISCHLAVMLLLIGDHIKISRSGETEDDRLLLARLPASLRLIDRVPDRV